MKYQNPLRLLLALLSLGLVLTACGQSTPTAAPQPPASTATSVPPTATPVPPTATSIPPTATPVPPTATPVPPTATAVPPTATPLPPTSTPTQVVVVRPTVPLPQPTAGLKYPAVTLTSPDNGFGYWCTTPILTLKWSFSGTLADDEWFVVEKRKHGGDWVGLADWTKDSFVNLNSDRYGYGRCAANFFDNVGTYDWRVRVVQGDKSTHTMIRDVAPPSEFRTINYG